MIHNSSNILEVINYYNFTHRHSFALTLNLMVNYGLRKKKGVENVLDWLWHFFSYVTVNKHIHVEQTLCFHKYQGLQPQVLWNVPLFKQNFFFFLYLYVWKCIIEGVTDIQIHAQLIFVHLQSTNTFSFTKVA